jgi:hypothetical protein
MTSPSSAVATERSTDVSNRRSGAVRLITLVSQSLPVIAPAQTPALNIAVSPYRRIAVVAGLAHLAGLAGLGCWMAMSPRVPRGAEVQCVPSRYPPDDDP